jgi:Ankyrin repeats (3 copies)
MLGLAMAVLACQPNNGANMSDKRVSMFPSEAERDFVTAVIDRRMDVALRMAERLPNGVNTTAPSGETALLYAVFNNDAGGVAALLAAGAKPDGGPNRTPLHPATRDKSGKLLKMLLDARADPNLIYNNETPLLEAALVDARDNAVRLIDAGADINKGNQIEQSPAMTAAAAGHWMMVDLLIEKGASPWHSPPNGYTLASLAASDRLLPTTPEGQARDKIIARFKAMGYPWPPPKPPIVRQMMAEGRWPPKMEPPR